MRLALALLLALAPPLRGADAWIGSPAPAESSCIVAAGARTFDLGALGAAPLRFTSRDAGSPGWVYAFSACADVPPCSVSTFCDASLRGSVIQATVGACHSLGTLSTRVVTATESGVVVSFSGGDRCGDVPRSTSITIDCADTATPEIVHVIHGEQPCSYSIFVRARAGCPANCGRDNAGAVCGGANCGRYNAGAVCGGAARGTCVSDQATDMPALCACSEGFGGRACELVAVSPKADVGEYNRQTIGMGLLVSLAIFIFNFVTLKNNRTLLVTSTLLLLVSLFTLLKESFAPETLVIASISPSMVQMQVRPQQFPLCVGVSDHRTCWAWPNAP